MEPLEAGDPETLGAYRLMGRLGSGGMGEVFLGRAPDGRLAAIKAARAELARDAMFRRRFAYEIEAARKVDARFTAAVLDADADAVRPWLATEYIAGVSITTAVIEQGPLPPDALRALVAGIATALDAIHAAGLTHRDLKPSNVLLADDGPRVIDFGIARSVEQSQITRTGQAPGTPGYMAPEQLRGGDIGPHTDVYALGATLVFAATGRGPYGDGDMIAMIYRTMEQDPDLDGVPEPLRRMAARCLAKDAGERPTVAQLRAEFAVPATVREGRWLPPGFNTARAGGVYGDTGDFLLPPPAPTPPPQPSSPAPMPAPAPPAALAAPAEPVAPTAPAAPPASPAYGAPYAAPQAVPSPAVPPPTGPPAGPPAAAPGTLPPAPGRRGMSRRSLLAVAAVGAAAVTGGAVAAVRVLADGDGDGGGAQGARESGAGSEKESESAEGTGDEGTREEDQDPGGSGSDLPRITSGTEFGEEPKVATAQGDPPKELMRRTLVQGKGRKVGTGDRVEVQYVMQSWGRAKVVDSSFSRTGSDVFRLGVGEVIEGWDKALTGKRTGSRIQFSVPPDLAYGDEGVPSGGIEGGETLVFTVDIMKIVS